MNGVRLVIIEPAETGSAKAVAAAKPR
jgi:hypothetical protein